MEVDEKKLLTYEQVRKDLKEVQHTRKASGPVLGMCILFAGVFIVISLGLLIPGIAMLVLALILIPKIGKEQHTPAETSFNPDNLIYGTDVCINRRERYDDEDRTTYYEAIYEKAGLIRNAGMFSAGYPYGDDVQIGDRFYTVALRDNPKVIQYYSMKEWYLGEPENDE